MSLGIFDIFSLKKIDRVQGSWKWLSRLSAGTNMTTALESSITIILVLAKAIPLFRFRNWIGTSSAYKQNKKFVHVFSLYFSLIKNSFCTLMQCCWVFGSWYCRQSIQQHSCHEQSMLYIYFKIRWRRIWHNRVLTVSCCHVKVKICSTLGLRGTYR